MPPSVNRRAFMGLGAGALLGLAGCRSTPAPPPPPSPGVPTLTAATTMPGRAVWGHYIGQGLPPWDGLEGGTYGEHYYLDLVHGGQHTPLRPETFVPRAQQAGLSGMHILLGKENKGTDFLPDWLPGADATWRKNSPASFSLAPCLAEMDTPNAVRLVSEYVSAYGGHPCVARVGDAYVVFLYGARYSMAPADWDDVRGRLREAGIAVFLVGDILPEASRHRDQVPVGDIEPYLRKWDASWLFESNTLTLWPSIADMVNRVGRPYAGGVTPGYNRETSADGAIIDARGTRKFREEWQLGLASGATWQTVVTWNDLVEDTDIVPTSTWNTTRADINAFFSAQLRGVDPPWKDAQLYVTTPKFVRVGDVVGAEAMVLNPTRESYQVQVEVRDASGQTVVERVSSVVGPGAAGDATSAQRVNSVPERGFFRVVASISDDDGRVLHQVVGAPVSVLDPDTDYGTDLRRTYYSVPARNALAGPVTLELQGSPVSEGGASAMLSGGDGHPVRFLDIMQNTRLVERGYDATRFATHVPLPTDGEVIIGGQRVRSTAQGFYLGRVIDDQDRVGYSDPVRV